VLVWSTAGYLLLSDGLSSPFLDALRDQLAKSRISAIEDGVELDLAIGDHTDVIAELRDLVAEHPLRERLPGLLMLALYRAGRQADALAVFRDVRRVLSEELGIEPAAPVQQLHQQILAGMARRRSGVRIPLAPPSAPPFCIRVREK